MGTKVAKNNQKSQNKPAKKSQPKSAAEQKDASKRTKHSKKQVVIVISILLGLGIVGGLAAWLIISNQQPEMSDWAEVYLSHIKTVREQDYKDQKEAKKSAESNDESFWNDQSAAPKVSFYESENQTPTMVVNYTSIENNLSYNSVAVYSIQNEEIYLLNYENTNLYYVYDIDADTYNFYLKHDGDEDNTYIDIDNYFKDPEADETEYEKTCSADEKAENYCGDTFVEEDVTLPSFEYSDGMSNKELAEAVANTSEEVVTETAIKEETGEKLQASAEKAKERIKEKEEAKEFFMVGDQKVRFGKYESAEFDSRGVNWNGKAIFVLNPDFTVTFPGSGKTGKFVVRTIQHGDVPSTCVGESCPPYMDDFNGYNAIFFLNGDGSKNDRMVFPFVTKADSEKIWGNKGNSAVPADYDIMPVYGQAAVYYRFLGK